MGTDDPFYTPGHVAPRRPPRPGEPIWELRTDHVTWSCFDFTANPTAGKRSFSATATL